MSDIDRRVQPDRPNFFGSSYTKDYHGHFKGIFIGKVKDNRDPNKNGKIDVYIAQLGGDEFNPRHWSSMSYASPFLGSTTQEVPPNPQGTTENKFASVRHSYGMWYNVPDIDNFVLCVLTADDHTYGSGYWFACLPNQYGHHMVPAVASSSDIVTGNDISDAQLRKVVKPGQELPVVEANEYNESFDLTKINDVTKPLHEIQVKILVEQGLDRKNLTGARGIIGSSSHRETPSGVFGVSTPGRPLGTYPDPNGTVEQRKVRARRGGHTFVMDDGDRTGRDNITRWRSSGGHTILMDDTDKILYITNSTGTVWMEMNAAGHLNVYSANSINFRTTADFNFHADRDINLNAGGSVNIKAGSSLKLEGSVLTAHGKSASTLYGGTVNIGASGGVSIDAKSMASIKAGSAVMIKGSVVNLNSGAGPSVNKPQDIAVKASNDTRKDGNGQWQVQSGAIKSAAKIVPAHEPWPRSAGTSSPLSNGSQSGQGDGQNLETDEPVPGSSGGGSGTATGGTGTTKASGSVTGLVREGAVGAAGGILRDSSGNPVLSGTVLPGVAKAVLEAVPKEEMINAADMARTAFDFSGTNLKTLTEQQGKALLTQIAKSESRFNPQAENKPYGYIGMCQMGAAALKDLGYISEAAWQQGNYQNKSGLEQNKILDDPNGWSNKDQIRSKQDFLNNVAVQEKTCKIYMRKVETIMQSQGLLSPNDDAATTAGKLATGWFGVGNAKKFLNTGVPPTADNYARRFAVAYSAVDKFGGD